MNATTDSTDPIREDPNDYSSYAKIAKERLAEDAHPIQQGDE